MSGVHSIDGGRFALRDGLQIGAVVAGCAVTSGWVRQWVAVHIGGVEPDQVLPDPGGVGAAGVLIEHGGFVQRGHVVGVDGG